MLPGRQPACPGVRKTGDALPDLTLTRHDVPVDRGARGGVRRGLRLPAQGDAAADLPAHAGVPAAHGDHDRRGRSRSRRSAPCTWRTRSPSTAPIAAGETARRSPSAPDHLRPHAKGQRLRPGHHRARRRRAGVGGDLDVPAPRRRRRRRAGRGLDRSTSAAGRRHRVAAARRPRPPLRRGVRRPQPDPPLPADRQGVRLPAPDRARHVDARPAASPRSRTGCPTRSPSRWRSRSRCCCPARWRSGRAVDDDGYAFSLTRPKDGAPHLVGRARAT